MTRLFVAIDPPPSHRLQIKSICRGLPGARWIKPEQIHLTLRFIGEVDGNLFRQIIDELAAIKTEPLTLKIKGIGHFPPRRSPRVIWLGLEQNDSLVQLRNRIERSLTLIGLKAEGRKFAAHITIARLKNTPINKIKDFLAANYHYELPPFKVKEFNLFSSTLNSSGATHQIEASYPLKI
ncbi:MAG: RNA 2',3'-cyclic phosphodiesterase [Thermodesulfobacteriota bacterium]